jgi:hypothetical protein
MGLMSKSSQPAASACSRSPAIACAVSAMTGIARVAGSALSCLVASQPSTPGRLMSMRTSAGVSDLVRARPLSPSTAVSTSYPRRWRRRESMSRFISLSSTSRIFAAIYRSSGADRRSATSFDRSAPTMSLCR